MILYVGGIVELFSSSPKKEAVYLKQRAGLLALKKDSLYKSQKGFWRQKSRFPRAASGMAWRILVRACEVDNRIRSCFFRRASPKRATSRCNSLQ